MKRVYITALTNERYIPGVMALARSLYEVRSEYSIAVMIPAEKEDSLGEAIRAYGILDIPGTFLLAKENIRLVEMDTSIFQFRQHLEYLLFHIVFHFHL